ncbi:MAG: hypothetical protein ACTSR2_14380 [Candidatus Hodarchaeales archaeon]
MVCMQFQSGNMELGLLFFPHDNTRICKTDVIQKGVIVGINKEFLKRRDNSFAWIIIEEASEWVLNMLDIHVDDQNIPSYQIAQFLHYFRNMLLLENKWK